MINSSVTDIPTTFQPTTEPASGHISTWALTLIGLSSLTFFVILLFILCRCVRRRSAAPFEFRVDGDDEIFDNYTSDFCNFRSGIDDVYLIEQIRSSDEHEASPRIQTPPRPQLYGEKHVTVEQVDVLADAREKLVTMEQVDVPADARASSAISCSDDEDTKFKGSGECKTSRSSSRIQTPPRPQLYGEKLVREKQVLVCEREKLVREKQVQKASSAISCSDDEETKFKGNDSLMSLLDDEDAKFKGKGECKPSRYQIKKTFTVDGGVLKSDDIILTADPGCLAKNTDIVMERVDHQFDVYKSLLDLGLIDAAPRVVKFSPGGLKFSKPVDLKIKSEKTAPESERFILHGFYNPIYQKIIWELLTNGVEENDEEGVIHAKISSFSFYSFISARRRNLARIISHLSHSFTCQAYLFFRRSPSMETIDIAVVLVSEFFYGQNNENRIKHLRAEGFVEGERGLLRRINTRHRLELFLQFPGIDKPPYQFQVDQAQLDSVGFVIDHFKEIDVRRPANGRVKISKAVRKDQNESLWILNVNEENQEIQAEVAADLEQSPSPVILPKEQSPSPDDSPAELEESPSQRILPEEQSPSPEDSPADLQESPSQGILPEEQSPSPDDSPADLEESPSQGILPEEQSPSPDDSPADLGQSPSQGILLEEQSPSPDPSPVDLEESPSQGIPPEEQSRSPDHSPGVVNRTTKLTQEEIIQMSREVGMDWDHLAALMDIPYREREEIRFNFMLYQTFSSKAEHVFRVFNDSECFDRKTLVKYLKELKLNNVKKKMLPMDNESESEEMGIGPTATSQPEMQLHDDTPLSSREMYRLSRHLVVNWDELACLLGIEKADRNEARYNICYHTSHSRAEKILAIFNNMEDFSRQKLAQCLEEMGQLDLKDPVIKGEWRK